MSHLVSSHSPLLFSCLNSKTIKKATTAQKVTKPIRGFNEVTNPKEKLAVTAFGKKPAMKRAQNNFRSRIFIYLLSSLQIIRRHILFRILRGNRMYEDKIEDDH